MFFNKTGGIKTKAISLTKIEITNKCPLVPYHIPPPPPDREGARAKNIIYLI